VKAARADERVRRRSPARSSSVERFDAGGRAVRENWLTLGVLIDQSFGEET
jgi:hypothetical protein